MIDNLEKIQNKQADPEKQTVTISLEEYGYLIRKQTELHLAERLAKGLTSYRFYEALEAIGWPTYDRIHRADSPARKEV